MGAIHDRFKAKERGGVVVKPTQSSTRSEAVRAPSELDDFEIRNAFSKQKYIIANHPDLGEVALVFPNFLVHADMAEAVFRRMPIVAAGFFDIYADNTVRVYGRSESLNRDSRATKDATLIERSLGIG